MCPAHKLMLIVTLLWTEELWKEGSDQSLGRKGRGEDGGSHQGCGCNHEHFRIRKEGCGSSSALLK